MSRIYALFFSIFALFYTALSAQTGDQLANYLGTTSNPLQLTLTTNGPNWGSFTIAYQGIGGVPWSSDSSNNWSAWNVYDTANPPNYYGTITLTSDGNSVQWSNYSTAGTTGYYLDGISLDFNSGNLYELTVQTVIVPTGQGGGSSSGSSGPFPLAPPATPAVYPGTSTPIVLQVVGDQIMDNNGDVILLKGLDRPSLEWSATGQYLSTQDLSNIANWTSGGAVAKSNVIRVRLYQGYWFDSEPVTQIGSYKQIINAIVYYATQLGMAVILDLHWVEPGMQSNMANLDSITFWQQVAADYASFGTVLFELYNEPVNISQSVWLNGDGVNYAGYQQLYNAVRGTGAQNICIIGGLNYAYDLSFVSPSFGVVGTNIVYCSHPYNSETLPGNTSQGGTLDNSYAGVLGNFPLIFTEFGTNEASSFPPNSLAYQNMYSNILTYINANNIHYTGTAWWVQDGDPQFPALISDWDGTALYGGINVHDDIIQNPPTLFAGDPGPFVPFDINLSASGLPSIFDSSKFGPGVFCWGFGDASGQCTTNSEISHVYARPGSYVVTLIYLQNGVFRHLSRTIKIHSGFSGCSLTCPARDAKVKRCPISHGKFINLITWKAPKSKTYCQTPVFYLVFRDASLTELVGEVRTANSHGVYKIKDKSNSRRNTSYAIVGVDQDGHRSLPVVVRAGKKQSKCGCCVGQKNDSTLLNTNVGH